MLAYSARKINANLPPLYSILNPETNSDSPSAKSKGARLTSATQVASHINLNTGIRNPKNINCWDSLIEKKSKLPPRIKKKRRIKANLIS